MKKLVGIFFLILIFIKPVYADPISLNKAKEIASAFLNEGSSPFLVKSAKRVNSNTTNLKENAPLYIFSRGENQGFVIVSGDDCLPLILGYTAHGDYVESQMPPALLEMITGYSLIIEDAQNQKTASRVPRKVNPSWKEVFPLVKTHWHQAEPYNNLCPFRKDGGGRALTGCVATAAAQVVYYWHKDASDCSGYNTPTYSYGDAPVTESFPKGTFFKWDLMQKSYNNTYPQEMGQAVSTLMSIIGTSTWLTYGASTSGQISNLVDPLNRHFALNSTCWYKSGKTQEEWERLVYEDLIKGRPIVYSGVHPTNGGHAVVLDGYRATDGLFHFNFGWGGQGDGYYTIDDQTGMNGFNSSQGMTFRIAPQKINLSGTIHHKDFIQRTNNTVKVQVTNKSTLDYKGLYLFCLTTQTPPTTITNASRSNTTHVIPVGKTTEVEFQFKPSADGTYYLYLTDENMQVLDTAIVQSLTSVPQLDLEQIAVNGIYPTTQEKIQVNGKETIVPVHYVYNTQAKITALLYNGQQGTYCEPTLKCELYEYNQAGATFTLNATKNNASVGFEVAGRNEVEYTFANLDAAKLYQAKMNSTATTGARYEIGIQTPDSVVYFRIKTPNLTLVDQNQNELTLKGNWNDEIFAKYSKDSTITRYDLTQVDGISTQPMAANKNALFYINDTAKFEGTNVIRNEHCAKLQLFTGYDFQPKKDFIAAHAVYYHNQPAAQWNTLILPFDCNVPSGIMARKIKELKLFYIYTCDSVNTQIKAGTPYIYMSSSESKNSFEALNSKISINIPSTCTDSVKGTFVNLTALNHHFVLDNEVTQYFSPCEGQIIPAMTAYLDYNKKVNSIPYGYNIKDRANLELASLINQSYLIKAKHKDMVTEQVFRNFESTLSKAETVFTQQPAVQVIQENIITLQSAINTYRISFPESNSEMMADMTYLIQNQSFETGTTKGWEIEKYGAESATAVVNTTANLNNYMSKSDGTFHFSATGTASGGSIIRQSLNGLPLGKYRMKALVATETGHKVTLLINEKETEVVPSEQGSFYFTEGESATVDVTDGTLRIGAKCNGKWYKVDHFRLDFLGMPTTINDAQEAKEDLYITTQKGTINIRCNKPTNVRIYSIDGQKIKQLIIGNASQVSGLRTGIYIVNGKKVVVP